jgi:hypothetical protein
MIIKGGAAGNVGFWSRHLMRDDTNEAVRLVELTGVIATTLHGALREMQAIGRQSRSRGNFMYQANINPHVDDDVSHAQMLEAVDRLERNLGLVGHQRVIVEHVKHGRRHWHAIWNRVDVETLKVADITGNYAIHARTARELEEAFGLRPTPPPDGRAKLSEKLWERNAEEESGITRARISADMTRCWHETDTGRDFRIAIERLGYRLARGDRRDYCVLDQSGRAHSLARRLTGIDVGAVRARLADIDPATLPSVSESRARQRAENPDWISKNNAKTRSLGLAMRAAKQESFRRHHRVPSGPSGRASRPAVAAINGKEAFRPVGSMMLRRSQRKAVALGLHRMRGASRLAQARFGRAARSATRRAVGAVWNTAAGLLSRSEDAPVRRRWGIHASLHLDAGVDGRAAAAFDWVMARWQAAIDAASVDPAMTPEQRAAAVVALRSRQLLEARAARRKIIEEEKQRMRAAKRAAPGGSLDA